MRKAKQRALQRLSSTESVHESVNETKDTHHSRTRMSKNKSEKKKKKTKLKRKKRKKEKKSSTRKRHRNGKKTSKSRTRDNDEEDEDYEDESQTQSKSTKALKRSSSSFDLTRESSLGKRTTSSSGTLLLNATLSKPLLPSVSGEEDDSDYVKLMVFNVNGLRAIMRKSNWEYTLSRENADIVMLTETKVQEEVELGEWANEEVSEDEEGHVKRKKWIDWNVSTRKKGYCGITVISKPIPLNVSHDGVCHLFDGFGRATVLQMPKYAIVCLYVPNSGAKLSALAQRRQWNANVTQYVRSLQQRMPVIVCGDMNVARTENDLARPKSNRKSAGFTEEEREDMETLLRECDLVDMWRSEHEDVQEYTYWGYRFNNRERNVGWRLDYFLVSRRFAHVCGSCAHRTQVLGSDHCPVVLLLNRRRLADYDDEVALQQRQEQRKEEEEQEQQQQQQRAEHEEDEEVPAE